MSKEITNSKLLDHLLECAQEIKKKNGNKILSINHVFIAAMEYIESFKNPNKIEEIGDVEEIEALLKILGSISFSKSLKEIKSILSSQTDSYIDDYLFRKVSISSKCISEKKGKSSISADIFLQCMLETPSDEIKIIIGTKKEEPAVFPDFSSYDLTHDFSKIAEDIQEEDETEEEAEIGDNRRELIAKMTDKAKNMQKDLSKVIFGQDNAISIFSSGYFQAELKSIINKDNKRPKATFLFAGPPGVGKTYLAETAAKLLGWEFMRYDMSGYSERDALMELLGTNKSFQGNKEGGLTGFVAKHPKSVLLFDEIEKANIAVIHLFLQVLDAGRLRDSNSGKEVDFSQTVLIFTTNAGRKLYEGSVNANLSGISRKTILRALETDVDPKTGKSAFPAAICSRFATGNVVMFNHMEAHTLRKIAEKEITENIKNLEEETGIKCTINDDVYSCVLFSEGGSADARTVKSRANSFFSNELYELLRLVSDNKSISDIENIDITLELPENEEELRLFRDDSKGCILSFGDPEICSRLDAVAEEKGYRNVIAADLEEAKSIIDKQDIEIIFCDLDRGDATGIEKELNIEDVDSPGRTLFKHVCDTTDIPLYLMSYDGHRYSDEEKFSLTKEGVRDIVDFDNTDGLNSAITEILLQIHQQRSMINLAKASKIVKYETSQSISEDGKRAEIKVFDIDLDTAVDAEDRGNILSGVSKPNIKFTDIIGAESAKSELEYFVDYLKNPKEYSSKGLGVPKGVLFYGPPGTGKTMLAKAVAGESDVTFICAEGNQFLKKYVGEGEEAVHALFATAKKYAPAIIFIDEIDAIAIERRGGESKTDSILTAFLAEMDGFKTDPKKPIFVMAASNFDVRPGTPKSLDSALLRRFDRHICIDLPDKKARIEYINMKIKNKSIFNLSEDEIENIAVRSTGMSLAQLASVFEFSMRIAVREKKSQVDDSIFEEAFETFIYGDEKKWDVSELRKTAYHEAGHAFLCWYSGETPSYLTIVARGNHGGYMLHGDTENRGSYTKKMLTDRIRTALGGRAAELVFFGEDDGMTTGASGDLRTATAIAKSMICDYGMDDSIGLAVVCENELSDGLMAQQIRNAVNNILKNELNAAKDILSANADAIDKIVEELLIKNHMTAAEIDNIFSKYAKK